MNTKKIWMLAIIFGTVMSIFFYIMTSNNSNANLTVSAKTSSEEENDKTDLNDSTNVNVLNIKEGKRAISIAVNEVQSVSGFVRPGSYVDIVSILPVPVGKETSSKILLSNVKVLAAGKTFVQEESENQEPYQMVTLEVSPTEGASLAFAKEIGVVTLMLRGEEDQESVPKVTIPFEQLTKGTMPK
jgi:pilus assembly protein CpaB